MICIGVGSYEQLDPKYQCAFAKIIYYDKFLLNGFGLLSKKNWGYD